MQLEIPAAIENIISGAVPTRTNIGRFTSL